MRFLLRHAAVLLRAAFFALGLVIGGLAVSQAAETSAGRAQEALGRYEGALSRGSLESVHAAALDGQFSMAGETPSLTVAGSVSGGGSAPKAFKAKGGRSREKTAYQPSAPSRTAYDDEEEERSLTLKSALWYGFLGLLIGGALALGGSYLVAGALSWKAAAIGAGVGAAAGAGFGYIAAKGMTALKRLLW